MRSIIWRFCAHRIVRSSAAHRIVTLGTMLLITQPALACEPVIPFIMTTVPALGLHSLWVLAGAVAVKCVLFTRFERRLPSGRAAWGMFVGNIYTTFLGILVAGLIGSASDLIIWMIAAPIVFGLCWLPARRLIAESRVPSPSSRGGAAALLTTAFFVSCYLFLIGQVAIDTRQLVVYWIVKIAAISIALFASVSLTTIWEEWTVWRVNSRPEGVSYFPSVLRTNLYVLILVLLVPAAINLPKRLHSPDFLTRRHATTTAQTIAPKR
ncbi:hypothetical protein Acid345_4758 [Candidatus Koribacter versatilis Ellin345]|uniref:Uncharacterized protein n=1 Tax=Koribacter versatilis (strain Ellin345) TaxID=204669 RepID=Q1IH93_KORVE|nr:hypothetical protein [Candidatus Koribacter versatilis]ABF43757.1 hypothetical protein Acid345_4758 [Candidatus Koribacter versatilis Ellin345]